MTKQRDPMVIKSKLWGFVCSPITRDIGLVSGNILIDAFSLQLTDFARLRRDVGYRLPRYLCGKDGNTQ
ncbi:unnamed protein product [Clavelina lepadiformis]|uniref:Uncharacterized protein n=1 Tax=Clavelina lepadiformis TaxID=159417 RepID=A0ABP0G9L1_CLALP